MKAYTDIEQSKKLAEILPIESADMCYMAYREEGGIPDYQATLCPYLFASWVGIPCWSLAALLNYLREIDFFPEIDADEVAVIMSINYYDKDEESLLSPVHNIKVKAESFIEACCEMITKLHEEKIL